MEEFKNLINENRRGGKRRRQILIYLKTHPSSTPYQIAKENYESVAKGYKITTQHLKEFKNLGVLKVEKRGKASLYLFTPRGEIMCKTVGLILPSNHAEEVIAGLNRYVREPLTNGDIKLLRANLTDRVIDVMEEAAKNFRFQKSRDYWPKPKVPKNRFAKLFRATIKRRGEMRKEIRESIASRRFEEQELPRVFITAMAVFWGESDFDRMRRMNMKSYRERWGDEARRDARALKIPVKEARKRIWGVYLADQSSYPNPYLNYFVWKDFEKISCGYHLIREKREVADKFDALNGWLEDSFLERCDPLVVDYIGGVWVELERRLEKYGQMWATEELSKLQGSSRSSVAGRKKERGGERD